MQIVTSFAENIAELKKKNRMLAWSDPTYVPIAAILVDFAN
jgi:hypothetical protein